MPPTGAQSPGAVAPRNDNAQFLRKQRAAIEAIAADNLKLKEEFMLENKFSVNPTTQTAAALIANLQAQADVYVVKITEEQRLKAELEHSVVELKEHIAQQRVQMGGINNSAEQAIKLQRKIKILEDRLQGASVRYNDSLTRSRALRARIDSLRCERLLFEELHGKLQRGAARKKTEIMELIARIAASHEAREKALTLQGQVKTQADKDVAAYEAEWRQLTHIVEQDRRDREAQRARELAAREEQMAQLFQQEFRAGEKRRAAARTPPGSAAARPAAEAPAEEAVSTATSAPERIKQLKAALAEVLEATGMEDADELLATLAEGEEASFSLFNYVNELGMEVDRLEETNGALRRQVDRSRAEMEAAANDERAMALRALNAELAAVEEGADSYEAKRSAAAATLDTLRGTVLKMFHSSGCATAEVMEVLAEGGEGVTERNLMQYLGVLEQRTNELLAQYCLLATDGSDAAAGERAAAVLTGKAGGVAPLQFVIEPPSTGGSGPGAVGGISSLGAIARGSPGGNYAGASPLASTAAPAGDEERPLSRGSLAVRARKAVAIKADSAVKIKAIRGGPRHTRQ